MSKKNKRQLPIISQSKTIFSTRQQARIIRSEALQMIESANEFTTNTRRVNRRSAFRVISRSLHSSEGLPFSVRKHQALTELSNYIALAKYNKVVGLTAFNTDLLPLSHPRSTRPHSMTASAMIRSHIQWVTDDPRITDESAKALIASAMLAPANSPQKLYAITRLENLPQGHVPLEAITAAYGGGNSAAAKRARVALQLRDRLGRWVEMFGGLGIKVKRRDGSTASLSGRAVGQNIYSPQLADVELGDGRIVAMPIRQARGSDFLASDEAKKDGFTRAGSTADDMGDPIIDEADLTFMESPSSFDKDERGSKQGTTKYTDQAYDVVKFDDNKRALTDLTETNKRRAELDLDDAAVDKQGETDPDSGKQFWDPEKPIFAVSRRGGTPFAYTQSWNDAQKRIKADQKFLDEEEGRTPLEDVIQDDNTPEDETPLVDQQDKFKKEEIARLPEPEAETPTGFEFKVPEDTYEVTNPKAPYRSVSEYDDPASLANMFQGDELIEALDDSLDTGLGRLQFPEEGEDGGEQEVPAEAILKAIDEKGGDAELALAQAYDKRLGTTENEDALYAQRESDRESKIGEPKKLGEVFDEVTKAPEPEEEAPVEETPVAELPEITEDVEPTKLPALLEGLTEEEQADFQESKDYTPYLSEDAPVDWPEGFTAPEDRELTPLEREQAINLANSDISDEDLVTAYNGAIKNQYDEDGFAPFSELDENNEEQTVQVASETLRDAMKLRNFDMDETNQQVLDGNWDEVDEEDEVALEEEEAPVAESPKPTVPDEGKGTKSGKDPLKQGWKPEDWINEASKDPRFHDMLKKNKDFTRLAGLYNDPTFDSPIMSDYQDKEMDGFESGSEVEAIDLGETGFEASPAGRVKYALDLLEDPTMSARAGFKDFRTGDRSSENERNILKAADEQLDLAKQDLSESDVIENKAIDSARATLGKEIAKLDKKIEKDKKAEEEAKIAPQIQYLLRGDRLELRGGRKAPFRNQEVKDFLDDNGFEWNDPIKAETKSGMDEKQAKALLKELKDRFGIDLLSREGQTPFDLEAIDETPEPAVEEVAPEAPSAEPKEKSLREREDDEFEKFLFPDGIPAGWTLRKEGAYNEVYYIREITNENGDRIVGTYAKDGDREPNWLLDMQSEEEYPDVNSLQEALDYVDKKSGTEETAPVAEEPAIQDQELTDQEIKENIADLESEISRVLEQAMLLPESKRRQNLLDLRDSLLEEIEDLKNNKNYVEEPEEAPSEEPEAPIEEPQGPELDAETAKRVEELDREISSIIEKAALSPDADTVADLLAQRDALVKERNDLIDASTEPTEEPTVEEPVVETPVEAPAVEEITPDDKQVLKELVSERRKVQDAIDEADLSSDITPEEKQALRDAYDELTSRIDGVVLNKPSREPVPEETVVQEAILDAATEDGPMPTLSELIDKLKRKIKGDDEVVGEFGTRGDMISKLMWAKWGSGFWRNESPYIRRAMSEYKANLKKLSDEELIAMVNNYYDEIDARLAAEEEASRPRTLTPEEAAEAERKRRVKEIRDKKRREREDKLLEEDDKAKEKEEPTPATPTTPSTPATPAKPAPETKAKKVRRLVPGGKTQDGDNLDYLPAGTVVTDQSGTEYVKRPDGTWDQASGQIGGNPWRMKVTLDPADGYEIKEIPGYDENAPGTGVVEEVQLHKKNEGDYVKQPDGTWKRIVKLERTKRKQPSDKAGKQDATLEKYTYTYEDGTTDWYQTTNGSLNLNEYRERDEVVRSADLADEQAVEETPATPDTPEATAPEAAKPMKTSVRGADLQPGDVTTKDFFTITNVEGGYTKDTKNGTVAASIVSGYYPGSEEQDSKLWADDTMFEVYRGVTPPEKGELKPLRQPRKEDFPNYKDYLEARKVYDAELARRKATWTAPEVESAPEPAAAPKTGPHIVEDKAKNLKPNDISFFENKDTGELEQFFVITEVLEGTVDYTRPDNGVVEKKTIVRGYYPGHQIQENDWNEDTVIKVIRGDAPENLPQPGDKPAIDRIPNGSLKGKAYAEKRAEITAARTEAGKGYTSPIKASDIPAARIENKPWRPDRPAFLGSAAELAKLGDGAAISEALKGKRVLVMDFETIGTGDFDHDNPDAPIQIAGAIYENGEKVDEINLFMNPEAPLSNWYYMIDKDGNRVIDPAKLLKSGDATVTDEWLATQPSIAEQLQKFADFAGPDAIWVAHNAEFDTNTFEKWAAKSGVDYTIPGVIDTVVIARSNYGPRGNKLKELAEKFGIDVSAEDLHNAATDIRILNPILEKLLLAMKPGNKQFDVPAREAEHASRLAKHNRDMAAWKAQMAADKVKTKPEFGPEGTTDESVNYVHTSVFGDQINEAWMLDDENTYVVNGVGTVLIDELRVGDFIEGKGGYVEIVDIQVDPDNSEKLLVYRRDPRTGEVVYERVEDSSTPGVGWARTRPIKFGDVRRRHDFKDKSAEEIKSLIPKPTPDNSEPQVQPESDPVKGEEVTDEQATKVISDALETISSGSKSDSTVEDAIKDLNVDETIKGQVIDREGGSDYHLDANGTPLAIGDRVRNVKNGRIGTIRTLIDEFGKDKRKNYLKVKFDDREKRENAAAGSLEIIREDDGDSILAPEPDPTEMGMSLPEEVTSKGLVASRIDPTDLKVGDRLDISGKTRVSAVRVENNEVFVATRTRGSRGGGFDSFPKTELVKVWRKPEDTPDSPVGMALPDMGAEIYEMAPPTDEGAGIPNALPEDNYEYASEKFPPTGEQRNVITAIMTGDDVVVRALAGTGKTSTLTLAARRLLEEDPKKKIVYVAFNRTVQEEAKGKMPSNVEARTGDSISFQSVDKGLTRKFDAQRKDKAEVARMKLRAEDISDELGIKPTSVKMKGNVVNLSSREIPSYVKQAVNNFAISADDVLGAKHFSEELDEVPRSFVEYANAYWDDITNPSGVFSINNAHITKIWALSDPDLGAVGSGLKTPADVIFFDEAQDINPVIAKVIANQKIQKVYVGDGNQAIYAFRGAEDQLDKTTATWDLPLTKSFRFGPEIAGMANRFLAQLDSKYRVEGAGSKGEVLEETMTDPDVVITRTNSGGFRAMIELLDAGKVVGITKGTKQELESLVASASWLIGNQKFAKPSKMHPDLAEFKNWTEVKEAVENGEAKKVKSLYDLIVQNGIGAIKDVLTRVRELGSEEELKDLKPSTSFKKLTLDQAVDGAKGLIGERINYEIKGTAIRLSGPGTFKGKDTFKDQKFRWDQPNKQWFKEVEDDLDRQDAINDLRRAIGGFAEEGESTEQAPIDVVVTTAHKSKGLQWDNVRIFDDFWGPRTNKKTGELEMPSDEELRLAYVALTRAQKKLDPGPLNWIKEFTEDEDEKPKLPTSAEQEMGMALPTENVTEEQFGEDTLATAEKVDPATEQIANAIIAALEAGTAPWRKPWSGGGFLPTSVATGKMYEGSNVLVLWAAQEKNGWTDNRWLTYKQAEKLGGNIKRGEKGTKIIHWTPLIKEVEKPDGTKEKISIYRPPKVITVFNVQQAENINLPQQTMNEPVPVTEAETILLDSYKDKPQIFNVSQDQAYYTQVEDVIRLPLREQFANPQDYFETLVHELAHSTGHKSRVGRSDLLDNYGTHKASRGEEELIAEISVSLAAARLGVEIDFGNVAAYAKGWLSVLQNDKTMIVKAARQAQKAVDHMLGKQQTPEVAVDEEGNPIGSGVGSEGKTGEEIAKEKE